MEEKNEERYERKDVKGGYIYGSNEIDYFKRMQKVDVVSNLMIGDFNKKGSYVIDKGIIDELVKMKKIYQYSFGSTMFCQSATNIDKYGKMDFAIKIKNSVSASGQVTTGYLQVLETVDRVNGYYQNTNMSYISSFSAPDSSNFVIDCLKYFNVVSKKEDGFLKKEHQDEDIDLIIARKKYLDENRKNFLDSDETEQKILFEKRLKILAKSAVGKKILDEFNARGSKISDFFLKKDDKSYYRGLNQMLDSVMETHSDELANDLVTKIALDKANADYANKVNSTILETKVEKEINLEAVKEQSKEQVKEQAKEKTNDIKSEKVENKLDTKNEQKLESNNESFSKVNNTKEHFNNNVANHKALAKDNVNNGTNNNATVNKKENNILNDITNEIQDENENNKQIETKEINVVL